MTVIFVSTADLLVEIHENIVVHWVGQMVLQVLHAKK